MYKANYNKIDKNKKKAFQATWDVDSSTSLEEEKIWPIYALLFPVKRFSSNEYKELLTTFNELYGIYKEIKGKNKMIEIDNKILNQRNDSMTSIISSLHIVK